MANVFKLYRVTTQLYASNFARSYQSNSNSILCQNIFSCGSYRRFSVANNVRWTIYKSPYSTSANTSSNTTPSSASQMAQDILASKVKETQEKSPEAELQADEKTAEEERERTKRATKFSMIFIGTMIAGMGGFMIFRWG